MGSSGCGSEEPFTSGEEWAKFLVRRPFRQLRHIPGRVSLLQSRYHALKSFLVYEILIMTPASPRDEAVLHLLPSRHGSRTCKITTTSWHKCRTIAATCRMW